MYQPFTIDGGSAGFTSVNSPPTLAGSVTCVDGECWVRFLNVASGDPDGANANLTDPATGVFVNGWIKVPEGATVNFGSEPASDTAPRDAVVQIDIYCTESSVVIVNQH